MRSTHPTSSRLDDLGKLLLRIALALLILLHGVSKIFEGIDPIIGMLTKAGLPPAAGYLVYVGEGIAPLLILFGAWTRIAALVVAINMIVAIMLVHSHEIFTLTKNGGWALELQGFYLITAIVIAMLGAGRYSIAGTTGRFN